MLSCFFSSVSVSQTHTYTVHTPTQQKIANNNNRNEMKKISPDLLNKCKEVTSIMKQAHEAIQQIMFDIEAGRARPHNNITRGGGPGPSSNGNQNALIDPNLASIHEYNNSIILSSNHNGKKKKNDDILKELFDKNPNSNNHSPKDTSNKPKPKHMANNNNSNSNNSNTSNKNSPRLGKPNGGASNHASPRIRPLSPNNKKKRKSRNSAKIKADAGALNHATFLETELPENGIVMSGAPVDSDEEKNASNL